MLHGTITSAVINLGRAFEMRARTASRAVCVVSRRKRHAHVIFTARRNTEISITVSSRESAYQTHEKRGFAATMKIPIRDPREIPQGFRWISTCSGIKNSSQTRWKNFRSDIILTNPKRIKGIGRLPPPHHPPRE